MYRCCLEQFSLDHYAAIPISSFQLEVSRLQLLKYPLRIIPLADLDQALLIRLSIPTEDILTLCGVILVDELVIQTHPFCSCS